MTSTLVAMGRPTPSQTPLAGARILKFGYSPSVNITISWRDFLVLTLAFCVIYYETLGKGGNALIILRRHAGSGVCGLKVKGYQLHCPFCCHGFVICWKDTLKVASDLPSLWFHGTTLLGFVGVQGA